MVSLLEDNSLGDTSLNPYLQILNSRELIGHGRLNDDIGNVTIEHVDTSKFSSDDLVLDKNLSTQDQDFNIGGIEAGDVNSLLEQFEESEASQAKDALAAGNNNISKKNTDADVAKTGKEQLTNMSIEEIAKKIVPVKRKSTILLENVTLPSKRNRKLPAAFRTTTSLPNSLPCSNPNSLPNSAPNSLPASQPSSCNSSRSCSPVMWSVSLIDHDYCCSPPKAYQHINGNDPLSPMCNNKENGEVTDTSTSDKKEESRNELYMGKYKIKKKNNRHRHHHRHSHQNMPEAIKDTRFLSIPNSPVHPLTGNVQRGLDDMFKKAREEFQKRFGKLEVPSIPEKKTLKIQSLNEPPKLLKLDRNSNEKKLPAKDKITADEHRINVLIKELQKHKKVEDLNENEVHPAEEINITCQENRSRDSRAETFGNITEDKEIKVSNIITKEYEDKTLECNREFETKEEKLEIRKMEISQTEIKEIEPQEMSKTKDTPFLDHEHLVDSSCKQEKPVFSESASSHQQQDATVTGDLCPYSKRNSVAPACKPRACKQKEADQREKPAEVDHSYDTKQIDPGQLGGAKHREPYQLTTKEREIDYPCSKHKDKNLCTTTTSSSDDSKPVEMTVNVDVNDSLLVELTNMDTDIAEESNQSNGHNSSVIEERQLRNNNCRTCPPNSKQPLMTEVLADEDDSGEILSSDEIDEKFINDEGRQTWKSRSRSYSPYRRNTSTRRSRQQRLSRSRSRSLSYERSRSRSLSSQRSIQNRSRRSSSVRSRSRRSRSIRSRSRQSSIRSRSHRSRSYRSRSHRSQSRRSCSRRKYSLRSRSRSTSQRSVRRKERYRIDKRYRQRSHSSCSMSSRSSSRGSRQRRSISCSTCSSSSRSRSRSFSRSHSRKRSCHSRSLSRSRSRSCSRSRWRKRSADRGRRYLRDRSVSRERRLERKRRQEKEWEDRRVLYIGNIKEGTTRSDINGRFSKFGNITRITLHFRDHGDNYCFVTFAYTCDAYAAVEFGNEDPSCPKYDICFGGRRSFCRTSYADLDNMHKEEDEMKYGYENQGSTKKPSSTKETDFDTLLKQALKNVKHR